uniref:AlNc14C182G8254 protein n=1 Tax=Albugo laibachii Nc14 TaxID=890382 RepID=F0WPA6_9STRA|nr:AlNc14C182G8254 [Albugo laibachii Nc14]|eukprot:CCA23152.1 AlNc14C182G8254 [Albugo laibachii Nc14]
MGKFRLAASPGYEHTLLVLYEPKNEIMEGACVKICRHTGPIHRMENSICMNLLKKLPFEETVLPSFLESNDKIPSTEYYTFSGSSNRVNSMYGFASESDHDFTRTLKVIEKAASDPPSCLRLEKSTHTKATSICRFCLTNYYGTAAIAVNKGQTQIVYLFYQLSTQEIRDFSVCKAACGPIKVMAIKDVDCQLRVVNHFMTSPIGDQFLAKLPLIMREKIYLKSPMSTGCVRAQYMFQENQCLKCLQMMRKSTMHQLSDSTALIALHPLTPNEEDVRKWYLGRCIDGNECLQLSFIPNVICEYELDLDIAERIQYPLHANSRPTTNADHNRSIYTQSASMLSVKVNIHDLLPVLAQNRKPLLPDHGNLHKSAPLISLQQHNVQKKAMRSLSALLHLLRPIGLCMLQLL